MVMRLLPVVRTVAEAIRAVVAGRIAHEAMRQALRALLVPLEVPNHLFLLDEHARIAVDAVKVLPATQKQQTLISNARKSLARRCQTRKILMNLLSCTSDFLEPETPYVLGCFFSHG